MSRPVVEVYGLSHHRLEALRALAAHNPATGFELRPWVGHPRARVLLHGDVPLPQPLQFWSSVALVRPLPVRALGPAVLGQPLLDYLARSIALGQALPRPIDAAEAISSMFGELCRMQADAVACSEGVAWVHPVAGRLVFRGASGWLASDCPLPDLVRLLADADWRMVHPLPDPPTRTLRSLESVILLTCLRWRSRLPALPSALRLRLRAFPDVASLQIQPALLGCLVGLTQGHGLATSAARAEVPVELASVLATALALAGLVEDYALDVDSAAPPDPAARGRRFVGSLARLARLLGLR